ncbi:MAG: putative 7-carboxy-7-deazaguanine synthase QueE [Clostridiaceae bacterium]
MRQYKVIEKFVSINGEGTRAGQLAVFVRFAGCNLNCSYCDTRYANDKDVKFELMTANEIYNYIKSTKVKNVTLTGGEPLMQPDVIDLLQVLREDLELSVEIETNGSIPLNKFRTIISNRPKFTMDYKLGSSKMEDKMFVENFDYLSREDTVKFVVGSISDLQRAKEIIEKYGLTKKANVYLSPVFGSIEVNEIVEFMKDNTMNNVNLQLQLHKIIWAPEARGV